MINMYTQYIQRIMWVNDVCDKRSYDHYLTSSEMKA